jgi:molybdenum cofactor biosynthesis enzyme MoaA
MTYVILYTGARGVEYATIGINDTRCETTDAFIGRLEDYADCAEAFRQETKRAARGRESRWIPPAKCQKPSIDASSNGTHVMSEDRKIPSVVDWEVTSRCNMTCGYCFGPQPELYAPKELGTSQMMVIAGKLAAAGVQRIVITGGEPLLRADIVQLLEELNRLGIGVVLSTNGYYLRDRIESIVGLLDWISLPIDGSEASINIATRGDPNHYLLTLANLQMLQRHQVRVKLGTVVCKPNYRNLLGIAALVSRLEFDIWKLYQFSPRDRGLVLRNQYEIGLSDFWCACDEVRRECPDRNIVVSTSDSRNGAYFLILPNGKVVTPVDNYYTELGDLLDDSAGIPDRINSLSERKLYENFKQTYGG